MNYPAIQTEATMTLKEITDLLEVEHNKAMRVVSKMAQTDGFGTVEKIATVYNSKGQTIQTYKLNRRQSMAVSAKLNTGLLMKVIDRLDELERAQQPAFAMPQTYAENCPSCRYRFSAYRRLSYCRYCPVAPEQS